MEGRLRAEALTVEIQSGCGHCDRKLTITLDDQLHHRVAEGATQPLVFEPSVDWSTFTAPNIIGDY